MASSSISFSDSMLQSQDLVAEIDHKMFEISVKLLADGRVDGIESAASFRRQLHSRGYEKIVTFNQTSSDNNTSSSCTNSSVQKSESRRK